MRFPFFFLFLFLGCIDHDAEEFKKNCPYDLKYTSHYLRVPVTISPHKLTYKIGDTIHISTIFTDSIYDLGTQQTFKIVEFPFRPITLLYRFYDGMNWNSGYRDNDSYVDSIYRPNYNYSSAYADSYRANTIYENGIYKFDLQLIFKENGRYVLLFSDKYQDYNASGNSDLNAEADAIRFEGQCLDDNGKPLLRYYICSMIDSGDDNLEQFEEELVYLDNEVYRDKLGSIEGSLGPLKSGSIAVEFSGFFGFEVVE